MSDKTGKKSPPALDPLVQSHIGRRLRSMFDEVASQAVPDRFLNLLDQLEQSDGAASPQNSSADVQPRAPAFGSPK